MRQVVIPTRQDFPDVSTHAPLPSRYKAPKTEKVELLFTRSEHARLVEAVSTAGIPKAEYIRAALRDGTRDFPALVATCLPDADEALHLAEGYRLQELRSEEIGAKRHKEEGEVSSARVGRRRRFGITQHEERGSTRYSLRLTPAEHHQAQEAAASIGLTLGGFIWRLLLDYPLFSLRMSTYEVWSDVEAAAYAVKAISIKHKE